MTSDRARSTSGEASIGYKHLLVHVDAGERALERLDLSVKLAQRWKARLTGLFAEGQIWGPSISRSKKRPGQWAKAIREAASRFETRVRGARLESDWWYVADREMEVGAIAARFCRYADLTILGQPDPDQDRAPLDLASHVVLESGRPVLIVPSTGHHPNVGRRAVIAWDGTREAARALHDALPLLHDAERVLLLEIKRRDGDLDARDEVQTDILRHLAAHGIAARRERAVMTQDMRNARMEVHDLLLNISSDFGADLVVMGARGRHGVPFPRTSRPTRKALQWMTAPVLLSI